MVGYKYAIASAITGADKIIDAGMAVDRPFCRRLKFPVRCISVAALYRCCLVTLDS